MSLEAHTQLQKLLDISEEADQIITQQRILKSLAFDHMHGRFEAVDTAHYKTFRWIFGDSPESEDDEPSGSEDEDSPGSEDDEPSGSEDEDSPGSEDDEPSGSEDEDSPGSEDDEPSGSEDEDSPGSEDDEPSGEEDEDSPGTEEEWSLESEGSTPLRAEKAETSGAAYLRPGRLASEPLTHWLSSGNGIYHISGKLGSGKSTLMKFLCEHKRTKAELQNWAGMFYPET
jgi:hypothetical protein